MERSDRPYAAKLMLLREELREATMELENLGFHHCEPGTIEYEHYQRIVWMELAIDHQIAKTPTVISAGQDPAPTNYVAEVQDFQRQPGSGGGIGDGRQPLRGVDGEPG